MASVRVEERDGEIYIAVGGDVQDALQLVPGDELEVRVDDEGVHLSPGDFSSPEVRAAFERVVKEYDETLRKLAQ